MENFGVTLTAVDLVVDFIVGQDNSTVNINEDTMDSEYHNHIHYYWQGCN